MNLIIYMHTLAHTLYTPTNRILINFFNNCKIHMIQKNKKMKCKNFILNKYFPIIESQFKKRFL